MDEILIEDKKYVSSKQAAKITGYAKDYIGQLCREGRVPARLVGRSWYVLESAIQDHRFGNHDPAQAVTKDTHLVEEKTWEFPRYEALQVEPLPSVNRIRESSETPAIKEGRVEQIEDIAQDTQDLHDSWKEWFEKTNQMTNAIPEISSPSEKPEIKEELSGESIEDDEVPVHLRVINPYIPPTDPHPEAPYSSEVAVDHTERVVVELPVKKRVSRKTATFARVVMATIALSSVVFVAIANGYADKYFISIKQVEKISGTLIYNK